jgi:hypothetical protein
LDTEQYEPNEKSEDMSAELKTLSAIEVYEGKSFERHFERVK